MWVQICPFLKYLYSITGLLIKEITTLGATFDSFTCLTDSFIFTCMTLLAFWLFPTAMISLPAMDTKDLSWTCPSIRTGVTLYSGKASTTADAPLSFVRLPCPRPTKISLPEKNYESSHLIATNAALSFITKYQYNKD